MSRVWQGVLGTQRPQPAHSSLSFELQATPVYVLSQALLKAGSFDPTSWLSYWREEQVIQFVIIQFNFQLFNSIYTILLSCELQAKSVCVHLNFIRERSFLAWNFSSLIKFARKRFGLRRKKKRKSIQFLCWIRLDLNHTGIQKSFFFFWAYLTLIVSL